MPPTLIALADREVVEVCHSVGNLLADGDQVTLVKDLTVWGAGQALKRGTLIKSIRLTGDPRLRRPPQRYQGPRTPREFVRKR